MMVVTDAQLEEAYLLIMQKVAKADEIIDDLLLTVSSYRDRLRIWHVPSKQLMGWVDLRTSEVIVRDKRLVSITKGEPND